MKNNKKKRYIFIIFAVIIFAVSIFTAFHFKINKIENNFLPYSEFIENVKNGNVEKVILYDAPNIDVILKENANKYISDNPRNEYFKQYLLENNITVKEGSNTNFTKIFQNIFGVVFFGTAIYIIIKITRKNNLKQDIKLESQYINKNNDCVTKFTNIAGNEEAKESVKDIIDFLKNPSKYKKYGARMPKGIIFYGPPGTGKTLMAKAVAGEADVPFFAVSGSDFVQMYVGVGASRIRELFKEAKKCKKAVIFIDEIDSLGKKRSANISNGNEERDQTLNALLTEMSGFNDSDGIIIIAATNRIDILDEALLRAGRFDRQIEIGLPDINARMNILKVCAENKPLSDEISIYDLAKQTVYFSGAMIENLLNEAAINAAKNENTIIKKCDIDKAYYTIIAGDEKKDKTNIKNTERLITAYHEAGHALITKIKSPENTVSKITIIPSTKGAGGFCVNIAPDKMFFTKEEIKSQIMINYAGRASEEIIFGKNKITTGAENDIKKATQIIKDYISKYAMAEELGLINLDMFESNSSIFLDECKKIADTLYNETVLLLKNNIKILENIASALLEKESLNEDELNDIVGII